MSSKIKRFEAFIIVRNVGGATEVHTVGASGAALTELVDLIGDTLGCALRLGELPGGASVGEDCELVRLGQHPDIATGFRIEEFDDAEAVQKLLAGTFDEVHLAHL